MFPCKLCNLRFEATLRLALLQMPRRASKSSPKMCPMVEVWRMRHFCCAGGNQVTNLDHLITGSEAARCCWVVAHSPATRLARHELYFTGVECQTPHLELTKHVADAASAQRTNSISRPGGSKICTARLCPLRNRMRPFERLLRCPNA